MENLAGAGEFFFPVIIIHTKILSFKSDLHITTMGPRVSWLEGEKVEALLPPVTLGFGVFQNRENGWLEVEVLHYIH